MNNDTSTANQPKKYRKLAKVVDALQWHPTERMACVMREFVGSSARITYYDATSRPELSIITLEGLLHASDGDWIIKGVNGEFYPCKPDVFAATYEPVEDESYSGDAVERARAWRNSQIPYAFDSYKDGEHWIRSDGVDKLLAAYAAHENAALRQEVDKFKQWPNVDALRECMVATANENADLRKDVERLRNVQEISTANHNQVFSKYEELFYLVNGQECDHPRRDDEKKCPACMGLKDKLERDEQRERIYRAGLAAVESLMHDSSGVAGLHLNGDVAPWDELRSGGRYDRWLRPFDNALALPAPTTEHAQEHTR